MIGHELDAGVALDPMWAGVRIITTPHMPWDRMLRAEGAIFVGEIGHLRWLLAKASFRAEIEQIYATALAPLREALATR